MRTVESILDLIGNTPLLRLKELETAGGGEIWAKLESLNPGFSVKDRIALSLIKCAEADGSLAPGGTIVEATAGNTGLALAMVGRRLGYRVVLTVPEQFSVEKQRLMRALGGEVVLTPSEDGIPGAQRKARELAESTPGAVYVNQFSNVANPGAHAATTGPEIYDQMGGDIDALVAGCGSGGTFSGVARFLKTEIPNLLAVAVEPKGSILGGGEPGTYVFVLEDREADRVVGSSMVMAKHGVPGAPYFWFEVSKEERRSPELKKHFVHTKLRLRSTEDGPTEIGGLILDPAYRRHPEKCGKALSIVRFAYIGAHPDRFEREVIAEMLSPFEENGQNLLWEAFGIHFTGMPYREADHLSARSKQFIADLFPRDPVYATLFPEKVQQMIGQTDEAAKAAVAILKKLGFRELHQVDPFDGGPYLGAARDAISSVRERRQLVLPGLVSERVIPSDAPLALLSAEGSLGFRATVVPLDGEDAPMVTDACRAALGVVPGDRVSITPLP